MLASLVSAGSNRKIGNRHGWIGLDRLEHLVLLQMAKKRVLVAEQPV